MVCILHCTVSWTQRASRDRSPFLAAGWRSVKISRSWRTKAETLKTCRFLSGRSRLTSRVLQGYCGEQKHHVMFRFYSFMTEILHIGTSWDSLCWKINLSMNETLQILFLNKILAWQLSTINIISIKQMTSWHKVYLIFATVTHFKTFLQRIWGFLKQNKCKLVRINQRIYKTMVFWFQCFFVPKLVQ